MCGGTRGAWGQEEGQGAEVLFSGAPREGGRDQVLNGRMGVLTWRRISKASLLRNRPFIMSICVRCRI
jgi:hypothetical protein